MKMDAKKRIEKLSKELLKHQYLYYVKAQPEISDKEYDRIFDELLSLERKYPEYMSANSPTKRIGSDLENNVFPEKEHQIPVLSLDKEYTLPGLRKWIEKTVSHSEGDLSFVVEEKIDGASIVLYYKDGMLDSALTRGNGYLGNDVTENIRTINQIPLIVEELSEFAVRGEIYITKTGFQKFNKDLDNRYSNPRNLAAGSIRNIKSSTVARIPLDILVYEGYFKDKLFHDHIMILSKLEKLGFPVSGYIGCFSNQKGKLLVVKDRFPGLKTGSLSALTDYVQDRLDNRERLKYEIDGLVVKVNELESRETLGHTSHHPRWAIAYKFDSPLAQTTLIDIHIQIGRNGRVTPVAILAPVKIAGSTVSRATLHNQEYIEMLELGIGDSVNISKRGDVIPAVEEVIDKNWQNPTIYKLTANCPFCDSRLVKEGAHHFCKNRDCPERIKRSIIYFVSKDQMDIDTLGEKTVEFLFKKGFVKAIPDLFVFDYDILSFEEGFKEKKIANIKRSIEKSKEKPFRKVLTALGFDGIGTNVVSELIENGYDSIDKLILAARERDTATFSMIEGFGETTAELLIDHFTDDRNLRMIEQLRNIGLNFKEQSINAEHNIEKIFQNQVWVITGTFDNFKPRLKAKEEIEKRGGLVSEIISSKVTHLLIGLTPGSKLEKAKELPIKLVTESQFLEMTKKK